MKHKVEKTAPTECRVPENIPEIPKFRTIVADPPWERQQTGQFGARQHYDLMSLDRIKQMPVESLAADDCILWLWTTNGCLEDALEVIKAWGFTYRGYFVWCKSALGLGQYVRHCTELCLVATRGRVKVKNRSQMNWGILPRGKHSEKPRSMAALYELMYDDPALELFCRRRPMHSDDYHFWCWGAECEGGSDIFIPGYPVPKYSFEQNPDSQTHRSAESGSTQEGA